MTGVDADWAGLPGGGGNGSDVTGSAGMAVTLGSEMAAGGPARLLASLGPSILSDAQAASTKAQATTDAINREMRAVSFVIARSNSPWTRPSMAGRA
jgi:hypothetical protein